MALSYEKIQAMERIKQEFDSLQNDPIENLGVTVGLINDNIFEWQCSISGPEDTSYCGGLFVLNVKFPDNYPASPPEVCFKTPIYHINVNSKASEDGKESLGHICISCLNWWNPQFKMREVLSNIFGLFYFPNVDSPYGVGLAKEFTNERATYEEKAKYYTRKYADPRKEVIHNFEKCWDFTEFVNPNNNEDD